MFFQNFKKHLKLLARVLPYAWHVEPRLRVRLILALGFIIITMALNIGVPLILKQVVGTLADTKDFDPTIIMGLLLAYGLLWTSGQITMQMREIVLFRVLERAIRNMSLTIFKKLHALSLRFHLDRRTGAVTNAIERAQDGFPHIFWALFVFMGPVIIEIIVAVGILWYLYSALYALSLLTILLIFMGFSIFGLEWSTKTQQAGNEAQMKSSARIVDSLLNYETVRSFGAGAYETQQCDALLKAREDSIARMHVCMETIHLGQGVVMRLGLTWLTWLSGTAVIDGVLSVSDFVLINGYLLAFMWPLFYFGTVLRDLRKGMTNLESIFAMIDSPIEITDKSNAKTLQTERPTIAFEDVHFAYNSDREILKGVSFEVPYGKTLAIVGSSGAGKSTISRLLFRFYDVTGGAVKIAGEDVRNVTQASVQTLIGIVPQDTALFNDTLYRNIAYGNPNASMDQVLEAVRLAHLDKFIKQLPQGLETEVGERGLKLSGGEKQRVAIARMLLKKPKIYVFDEATSSLDTQTEREIQKNINEIAEGETTVMIAHRLSTIVGADEIIVLDKGKVAERGTHTSLMEQKGLYAKLWLKQKHRKA